MPQEHPEVDIAGRRIGRPEIGAVKADLDNGMDLSLGDFRAFGGWAERPCRDSGGPKQ
jgi:hypothetical protein